MQMFRSSDGKRVVAIGNAHDVGQFRSQWLGSDLAVYAHDAVAITDVTALSSDGASSKTVCPRFIRSTAYHVCAVLDPLGCIPGIKQVYEPGAVTSGFINPESVRWVSGMNAGLDPCDCIKCQLGRDIEPLPYVGSRAYTQSECHKTNSRYSVVKALPRKRAQLDGIRLRKARTDVAADTLSMSLPNRRLEHLEAFAAKLQRLQDGIRETEVMIDRALDHDKLYPAQLALLEDRLYSLKAEYSEAVGRYTAYDSPQYQLYFDLKSRYQSLRNERQEIRKQISQYRYLLSSVYPVSYKGCYTEYDYCLTLHRHKLTGLTALLDSVQSELKAVSGQIRGYDAEIRSRFNELFGEAVKEDKALQARERRAKATAAIMADVEKAGQYKAIRAAKARDRRAKAKAAKEAAQTVQVSLVNDTEAALMRSQLAFAESL